MQGRQATMNNTGLARMYHAHFYGKSKENEIGKFKTVNNTMRRVLK